MKRLRLFTTIAAPILIIGALWTLSDLTNVEFPILFNFVFGMFVFVGYLYLALIQFIQVMRPKDWLTNLRMLIFSVLLVTIVTFIPSLVYQYVRLMGDESEFLRSIVNVTGRVSSLCILIILIAIFRYKRNEGD